MHTVLSRMRITEEPILMHIGALLRLDLRDLAKEPPTSNTLQVVRALRVYRRRDELATVAHVPYQPLPDELRRLLKRLNSAPSANEKTTKQ
jgi:hypothetical protein